MTFLDPAQSEVLTLGGQTVEIPAAEISKIDDEITVEFWAKGSKTASRTWPMEFLNQAGGRELTIHLPWSGRIYWDAGADGGGSYDRISKVLSTEEMAEINDTWVHWAFTKSAQGVMSIFRNGKLWHQESGKNRKLRPSAAVFNRGYHWTGELCEARIWRVARSEEEIAADRNKHLNLSEDLLYRSPEQPPVGPVHNRRLSWEEAIDSAPKVEDLDSHVGSLVRDNGAAVELGELSVVARQGAVVAAQEGPNATLELSDEYHGTQPALSITFPEATKGFGFDFEVDPGQWHYRVSGLNAAGETVHSVVLGAGELRGFSGFSGESADIVGLQVEPFHSVTLRLDNISWVKPSFNPEQAPQISFGKGKKIDTTELGDVFEGARSKGELSIELWAKPTDVTAGDTGLLFLGSTQLPNVTKDTYGSASARSFGSWWVSDGGSNWAYMNSVEASGTFMCSGEWSHLVLTKNVAANRMAIYHNGKLVKEAIGGTERDAHNSPIGLRGLSFGAFRPINRIPGWMQNMYFDGQMTGIRVWQREITGELAAELMRQGTDDLAQELRSDLVLHGPVDGRLVV